MRVLKRRTRLFFCALLSAALLGAAAYPPAPARAASPDPILPVRDGSGTGHAETDGALPAAAPSETRPAPPGGEQGSHTGEAPVPESPAEPEKPDFPALLKEIYQRRARRFVEGPAGPPLQDDFLLEKKTAQWALAHEEAKYKYVETWARERGVRFVEARSDIWAKELKVTEDRARFYVAQTLQLGYQYPGEEVVNRFGVGSHHIIELHRTADGRWLIGLEWYSDPLGDETETPAETPKRRPAAGGPRRALAGGPETLDAAAAAAGAVGTSAGAATELAARRYNREGAVQYADTYCGLAAGCGNGNKYNPKFRNYMGEGGDCANFVSQALRHGGNLPVPYFTRVDGLISHLRYAGLGDLVARGDFGTVWQIAAGKPSGFRSFVKPGDVLAYQYKGKMAHVALITGFDSRGYPVGNSHTVDRYHVPFDLGWDKSTIYWFVQMRE